MPTICYKYGLLPPDDWDQSCEDQIYKADRLWNRLVEIERSSREGYFAAMAQDEEVAAADARVADLMAARTDLISQQKAARKSARKKVPTPTIDAQIEAIKPALSVAIEAAKTVRKAAKERMADQLKALETARRTLVTTARQEAAADGLWWGHYNAVLASYDTARVAAMKSGGELRFRRPGTSGRLTNQIQGGMSVDDLFAGAKSQVMVAPVSPSAWDPAASRGDRRRAARTKLTAKVWSRGREASKHVTWTMVMHRPLPPDATIKEVVVHRTFVAGRAEWSVTFTLTVGEPAPRAVGRRVAINLGWRKVDGGIRIGTALAPEDDRPSYIVIPDAVLSAMDYADRLKSERDTAFAEMLPAVLAAEFQELPAAASVHLEALRTAPKPSLRRLALFASALHAADYHHPILPDLYRWSFHDRRKWIAGTNHIKKSAGHRQNVMREAVHRVLRDAAEVIVDMAIPTGAPALDGAPARNRHLAAPADMRQWIKTFAGQHGITHRNVAADTFRCHVCETSFAPSDPASLIQTCPHCSEAWDQDYNACRNMLASADLLPETAEPLAA